jgi:hypothetical protein
MRSFDNKKKISLKSQKAKFKKNKYEGLKKKAQ